MFVFHVPSESNLTELIMAAPLSVECLILLILYGRLILNYATNESTPACINLQLHFTQIAKPCASCCLLN